MILRELKDPLLDWDLQEITGAAGLKGLYVEILIHDFDVDESFANFICRLSDGAWYYGLIFTSHSGTTVTGLARDFATPAILFHSINRIERKELANLIKEAKSVEKDLATLVPLWGPE